MIQPAFARTPARVWNSLRTGSEPFPPALAAVVVGAHLYSMWVIGATYWADSIDFVSFGDFIARGALGQFYSGDRYFLAQHQMPGLPLLWAFLSGLDERMIWYALALIQHGFAAMSLITFALALRRFLPPLTIFVGALATSMHPFFSAFHNALMTESIMSSCALLAAAQFVNFYADRNLSATRVTLIAGSVVVGSMFRSYFLLFGLLLCVALFLFDNNFTNRRRATLCFGVVLLSVSVFPIYRYSIIGKLFLPNLDFIELTVKSMALPGLTAPAESALLELPELSSVVSIEQLRTRPISYDESIELSKRMLAEGQSEQTVRSKFRATASAMMTGQFLQNLRFTGSALGLLNLPFLGDPAGPGQLYLKTGELREHQNYYYEWFGWTQQENYQATFDAFVESDRQSPNLYSVESIDRYATAIRGHITASPIWAKDPLRLAKIPPDILVAGWLLFVIVMLFRAPGIAVLFVLPVVMVLIACLAVPIGSIRYAHPLFPFYLIGASFSCGWLGGVARGFIANGFRGAGTSRSRVT